LALQAPRCVPDHQRVSGPQVRSAFDGDLAVTLPFTDLSGEPIDSISELFPEPCIDVFITAERQHLVRSAVDKQLLNSDETDRVNLRHPPAILRVVHCPKVGERRRLRGLPKPLMML